MPMTGFEQLTSGVWKRPLYATTTAQYYYTFTIKRLQLKFSFQIWFYLMSFLRANQH